MDPLSAAASVLGILDVALRTTSALIQYADDTRGASKERLILAEEAGCLVTILQRLLEHANNTAPDSDWIDSRLDIIRQFRRAYGELAMALRLDVNTGLPKAESRFKAIHTAARWSFNKSEIYALIERVTRLQQHANMMLLNDQR